MIYIQRPQIITDNKNRYFCILWKNYRPF